MTSPSVSFLGEVTDRDGQVVIGRLLQILRITTTELATASGLSRDAVARTSRCHSPLTQGRMREVAEIIAGVSPWAGSMPQAFAWYRAQPIPSFGDQTPEDLVKEGRAQAVKAYLSRIGEGGYA